MPASPSWPLAAFATSLPGDLATVLPRIAALGFRYVDLVAQTDRLAEHLEALADSGLLVSCAALGRDLPADHTLEAADVGLRRTTLALLQRQVADTARLGEVRDEIELLADGTRLAGAPIVEEISPP